MATVQAALQEFYVREGLPAHGGQVGAIDWVRLFGLPVPIPNPPARKRVLVHHDAHHLVTGFGTDEIGEGEVGAWALAAGEGSFLALGYDLLSLVPGMVRAPRRLLSAFLWGRQCRTVYRFDRDELLAMDVEALRALALTDRPRRRALVGDWIALLGLLLLFTVAPLFVALGLLGW